MKLYFHQFQRGFIRQLTTTKGRIHQQQQKRRLKGTHTGIGQTLDKHKQTDKQTSAQGKDTKMCQHGQKLSRLRPLSISVVLRQHDIRRRGIVGVVAVL